VPAPPSTFIPPCPHQLTTSSKVEIDAISDPVSSSETNSAIHLDARFDPSSAATATLDDDSETKRNECRGPRPRFGPKVLTNNGLDSNLLDDLDSVEAPCPGR